MAASPHLAEGPDDVLTAVYVLAGRAMACGVSLEEIGEELSLSTDEVERLSDCLVEGGALAWCTLGHLALTHAGLERATRRERSRARNDPGERPSS